MGTLLVINSKKRLILKNVLNGIAWYTLIYRHKVRFKIKYKKNKPIKTLKTR